MRGIYDITEFGAVGDGKNSNTAAFAGAIEAARANGGGIIYVPPGEYLTGPIMLKSNMTLHISRGATLLGSHDEDEYPYVVLEGYTRNDRTSLITAVGEKNIAVEGGGVIDARGRYWWDRYEGDSRRPRTIQPILCEDVLIRDVTILNSPMWTVHPLCCNNVTVDHVTIRNPYESPNTDGINPESCQNVHISNCHIDVGDDCITLKAGQETEPMINSRPCENITVTNCTMLHGHGGVVIGSEMSGGVHNVVITNCVFLGTERGIRIKTRRKRGGSVTDVLADNILMKDVYAPITMNGFYRWGIGPGEERLLDEAPMPVDDKTPVMENIRLSNILSLRTKLAAMYIIGLPERPIRGLNFNNVTVEMENPDRIQDIAVSIINRPLCCLNGVNVENVENVQISGFTVRGQEGPAYTFKNCRNLTFDGRKVDETEEIF